MEKKTLQFMEKKNPMGGYLTEKPNYLTSFLSPSLLLSFLALLPVMTTQTTIDPMTFKMYTNILMPRNTTANNNNNN